MAGDSAGGDPLLGAGGSGLMDRDPRARRLSRRGRRCARIRTLPDQPPVPGQCAGAVAGPAPGQPLLPHRDHVRGHVRARAPRHDHSRPARRRCPDPRRRAGRPVPRPGSPGRGRRDPAAGQGDRTAARFRRAGGRRAGGDRSRAGRAVRAGRARHQQLRLESGARAGPAGPEPGGLRQPGSGQRARRRHHAGARGRRRGGPDPGDVRADGSGLAASRRHGGQRP